MPPGWESRQQQIQDSVAQASEDFAANGYSAATQTAAFDAASAAVQGLEDPANAGQKLYDTLPAAPSTPQGAADTTQPSNVAPQANAAQAQVAPHSGSADPFTDEQIARLQGKLRQQDYARRLKRDSIEGAKYVGTELAIQGASMAVGGVLGSAGAGARGAARAATRHAEDAIEAAGKAATRLVRPSWVRNAGSFVNWLKNLCKAGAKLTKAELDEIVQEARRLGVSVRLDPPHPNTPWNIPHLNIGNKGVHLPVPPGYQLPP
jgi:hypothetical protein